MLPATTAPVSVAALCAGYGGLELGLAMAGMNVDLRWYAEIDKNASQVMAAHHPDVPNLGDLTEITTPPAVDLIAAGFPCQPVSVAGRRRGIHDERWLIDDVCRLGRDAGAKWLLLENVPGILTANAGEAFARVIAALAENGFAAEWTCLRASDVGAPHRRIRWFCLGYADGVVGPPPLAVDWGPGPVGEQGSIPRTVGPDGSLGGAAATDTGSAGAGLRRAAGGQGGQPSGARSATLLRPEDWPTGADGFDAGGATAADPDGTGSQGRTAVSERADQLAAGPNRVDVWGPYADAVERWEPVVGRLAPPPVDDQRRLNPAFVEWMMGLPHGWVTDVLDKRTATLKCLGNGVVPQQAALALRLLVDQAAQPVG